MNILIVEDDLISRTVLSKLLSTYGDVDVAANGMEAVTAVEKGLSAHQYFQLICLDIIMPQMDGNEALVKIRQMERQAGISVEDRSKIIMTTALSGSGEILDSFRDECDGYLVKPFKPKDLTKLLDVLNIQNGADIPHRNGYDHLNGLS